MFLTNFLVFGNRMKHSFKFLMKLLKPFIILGENQSKGSLNLMIIKTSFPLTSFMVVISFSFWELLMSLRNNILKLISNFKSQRQRKSCTVTCLDICIVDFPFKISLFEKLYQTLITVFHRNIKNLEVHQKYSAMHRIFNSLLGV